MRKSNFCVALILLLCLTAAAVAQESGWTQAPRLRLP
jgi:hypothetical protein